MKNKSLLLHFLVCSTIYATAQVSYRSYKLGNDFVAFFVGNWTGDGEFASGKKISADLTFKLTLDSSWISYEHTDKAPNRYQAFYM